MDAAASWFERNSSTILWSAGFFILGVALSWPLGWRLPDTISSLFGAVAGAVGAVAGAFLLWRAQATREKNEIRMHVVKAGQAVLTELDLADAALSDESVVDLRVDGLRGFEAIQKISKRLQRLESQFHRLDCQTLEQVVELEDQIALADKFFLEATGLKGLHLLESRQEFSGLVRQCRADTMHILALIAPGLAQAARLRALRRRREI